MFLFKKNKELFEKLNNYLEVAQRTLAFFREGLSHSLEKGIDEHFEVLSRKTHREESNADDIRREIETEMFRKSLLPETREDLLEILEVIDRIPGRAESILNMMLTQQSEIHNPLKNDIHELLDISIETFEATVEATRDCFGKISKIRELARLIDNNESIGDKLERKMIRKVFESKMDTADKLIQKEIILELGAVCDLCAEAKDRLVICATKRSL